MLIIVVVSIHFVLFNINIRVLLKHIDPSGLSTVFMICYSIDDRNREPEAEPIVTAKYKITK